MKSKRLRYAISMALTSLLVATQVTPLALAQTESVPPESKTVQQQQEATYPVGVEVRNIEGTRTEQVGISLTDEEGNIYDGGYNENSQWLTGSSLPEGQYYIELTPPEGTTSQINNTAPQFAVATETPNVYSIDVNEENLGGLSAVYGAFELVDEPVSETYRVGAEVRGLDGTRTSEVGITVYDENSTVYEGGYNEYAQWLTTNELPEGLYYIELTTPEGTTSQISTTTNQSAVPTETPNLYTIELNEETLGNLTSVYGAFELIETAPVEQTFRLGAEVRGLDGTRTDEVGITVADVDGVTFEGEYNEYLQWLTTEELPAGQYSITLDTPEGTVSTINETTNQYAIPADETNVYNIILSEENLGNNSSIYGAFNLVEAPAETYQLGVEVRGLDGTRSDEAGITLTDDDGVVFEGEYNEYLQWLTSEELTEGTYTITLDTPAGTVSEINDTTNQYAVATDEDDVYTIELNEDNLGSSSAVYGAFNLVEAPAETYQLGVEVRGLDGTRTDEVGITVADVDGVTFEGVYNEYLQWLTTEGLLAGQYTITLDTPEGTVSEINDTTNQYAVATDEDDVYTIELNEDNLGSSSAVYGAFNLVEAPAETYQLGVEVRGLDGTRSDEAGITVTDADGVVFEGEYNEYLQWLTSEELSEGNYTITLDTPEGTVSEINDTTNQYAVATDEDDVYTIELNDENLGSSSAVYGAFRLVEAPVPNPDTFTLGVEVRGLDDRRTDEVGVTVTNNDGDEFTGSYNEYLQWLTD
ncbi:hypothetical protein, partial [Ruoffia sp. FAM 20858]|uniref:hypothetical protein n=2 Tax=unclassified Ruoffia TaxID=2862149 RepID=UPI00388435C8